MNGWRESAFGLQFESELPLWRPRPGGAEFVPAPVCVHRAPIDLVGRSLSPDPVPVWQTVIVTAGTRCTADPPAITRLPGAIEQPFT